jgi:hypothetical protein
MIPRSSNHAVSPTHTHVLLLLLLLLMLLLPPPPPPHALVTSVGSMSVAKAVNGLTSNMPPRGRCLR